MSDQFPSAVLKRSPLARRELGAPVALTGLYLVVYITLAPGVGSTIGWLSIVPLLVSALTFGARPGLVAGLLLGLFHAAYQLLFNPQPAWLEVALNVALTSAAAAALGYLRDQGRALRQAQAALEARAQEQTAVLAGAVQALQREAAEQDQAQAALRESEPLYRQAIEAVGAVPYVLDYATGGYKFIGDQILALTGYTPAEITPDLLGALLHDEQMLGEAAALPKAEAVRQTRAGQIHVWRCNSRLVARDGRTRWISDTSVQVLDSAGRPSGAIGILQDITDHKRAETALRESEALYRQAIESAGAVPYFQDYGPEKYTFMGEGIFHLTGYRPDEITPLVWNSLVLEAVLVGEAAGLPEAEAIRRARSGEMKVWKCDYRIQTRDGRQRWIADTAVEVLDEQGVSRGSIGIMQDITERKRALEAAQEQAAQLEQRVAQRTAELEAANHELEAFSYSVSHDLRAPLRAVDGYTRILVEEHGAALAPSALEYLDKVQDASRHMGQLIDDLLAFSRLGRQALRVQPISAEALTALVQRLAADLQAEAAGRQVELTLQALPACHADPALLRLVWANLLSNAYKYTRRRELARIEVGAKTQAGETEFFVRDNGAGFDMRYADRLFGVFERLHRPEEFEGTGVGLATVRRIVHRHGGRVWAESAPDQGAAFFFTLPGAEQEKLE